MHPQKFGFNLKHRFYRFPQKTSSPIRLFLLIATLMWVAERQAALSGRLSRRNLLNVYFNFVVARIRFLLSFTGMLRSLICDPVT